MGGKTPHYVSVFRQIYSFTEKVRKWTMTLKIHRVHMLFLLPGAVCSVGLGARGGGGHSRGVCQQVSALCGQSQ